ncbi:signal peptidase II [Rhodococcus sp. BP-252]|uniref:signal peptidase II n=1 Tax=unclassified Rhodococcus (in: high G+C Gram-positive bacteria) TaxID=192944 RepID=UPI001C9A73BB|nr:MULTISPECIES: signal peptidase II [unclassified Rhodococcus (in: high G+C Gram-positive bacteria)]MBY6413310.1 signal peptidase II [Rhodococcus sp. BP-320]MBY6418086.1 signal peptidase II [Rhodococcus sp. BP-321]MBY6422224.1 signal peptidase II [Rhodococcus sp. BP-324]MBY6428135.1 signal peptidase II [Rhodococcus sp. BP-323]MBY6433231.1 signal peptidase II [Rhodococcus sp. BP-322]
MTAAPVSRSRRSRRLLVVVAAGLVAVALVVDPVAQHTLTGARSIDLGVLQLRLAYNTGVAFSMGNQLPAPVLLTVTGLITAAVAVYAWRAAPTSSWPTIVGLGAIFAGAAANVIDRTLDGKVTDYLHTGWFPTFNLADTFLTCGVILLLAALFVESRSADSKETAS